ncbi:MAG: serine/threonine-protein kinase [Propionibacteriales bacterium]|nr:serine/threonine-protein kinase [Propionibacteriales bacterium]
MSSFSGSGAGSGDPAPGSRIGRFRILEQLGQGGMGVVYRAMEENLGREVALKVIAPLFAHDPEFRERFTREARSQASLESAHVVAVYAHGEEDGYLYIASQLIPGGDLGHLIRTEGIPSLVDALEIIEQVTSGLSDAHDAGLVHRDIKPGNVLVRRRPGSVRAYLADFGIARQMNADATRFSSSTVGTPSYMAPELHGGAKASASTDIYALGCLLWVALTGTPPFQGTSEYQLIAAHVKSPVPQLAGTSPMLNATNRILRTAMAKDSSERYQSAAEMSADLQAALRLPVTPGAAVPDDKGATAMRPVHRPVQPAPVQPAAAQPAAARPSPVTAHAPANPSPTPPAFLGAPPAGRRTSSKRWWVVGGVAAAIALGGGVGAALLTTGEDDPEGADFLAMDPKEIIQAAEKDMSVLEAARITGQFEDDQGDTITVDVTATSSGNCSGTMKSAASGGTAEILRVDEQLYLRADRPFWEATGDPDTATLILAVLGDKWVVENSLLESTEAFCDLDEFLERDGRENAEAKDLGEGEVGGQKTVRIEQAEGSQREVLDVRVAEPHYLLRIEESDVDHFEFADFDKEVAIKAPDGDDIVPLRQYLDTIGKALGALPGAEQE